jgi:hypothetical protein
MKIKPSRRKVFAMFATAVFTSGIGCVGPVVRLIIKLPWDKITSVIVNALNGMVIIKGLVGGQEVETTQSLSSNQQSEVKNGSSVQVSADLNGGKKDDVSATIQR